ncbi:hypothetical protein K1719_013537 [Acacia pycnantha]|nr:hypothetical protein K1719_013537 [Acacia pycnantha]
MEDEREVVELGDKQLMVVGNVPGMLQSGKADMGNKSRGVGVVLSKGKSGGRSSRMVKGKQMRKEMVGRGDGQIGSSRSDNSDLSAASHPELAVTSDPNIALDKLPLDLGRSGLLVDVGPVQALESKFWAGKDEMGLDGSLDADSDEGILDAASGPQQTKCDSVDRLRGISKIGFDGLACVPSVGRSGGLLAAWKSSLMEVEVLSLDRQMIHLRCRFPNDRWFCVTAVYAIPDRDHKHLLWSSLLNIASSMAYPWTVIGDFNDIVCSAEGTGGFGRNDSRFSLFSDRMRKCNLVDLGAVGPKFTWKGPKLNNG